MNSSFDKIICVGKNYLDHAKELGEAVPEEPVFFFKPPSCLTVQPTKPVPLPDDQGAVHHECEIVYRIRKTDRKITFDAVTLGLDLTLRDVQSKLKKAGLPWEAAKAFPQAAIIGPWLDLKVFDDHLQTPFELFVNGKLRQKSTGTMMRRAPGELLKMAAKTFTICNQDLFFTGTPKGVGAIVKGDTLHLKWGKELDFKIAF